MRAIRMLLLLMALPVLACAHIRVAEVSGDVYVRHGVEEQWTKVATNEILKPEDSIRSGRRSGATLVLDDGRALALPESTIIDLSDLRTMTRGELMLKLAMEGIRSLPATRRTDDFLLPMTTAMHGARREEPAAHIPPANESRILQLNGVGVLHENGFYATCILKAKQIMRLDTAAARRADIRIMIADSFEQMGLRSEALGEYNGLTRDSLDATARVLVERRIALLSRNGN